MSTFDFMKQFSMFATVAAASGSSAPSRRRMKPHAIQLVLGAFAAALVVTPSPTASGGHSSSSVLPLHATPGVTILCSEHTRTAHTESQCFRFHTAKRFNGHNPKGVSQSFEQQLRAAGRTEPEADTSNNVFVSAWQYKDANGIIHAMFSIRQLEKLEEYFAAIEVLLP
jgi:hypothetical protein